MTPEDTTEMTLKNLDLDAVDLDDYGTWSYGCGGFPLGNDEWSIKRYDVIDGDVVETRYKLPEFMNKMLKMHYKHGISDAKNEIRSALGI